MTFVTLGQFSGKCHTVVGRKSSLEAVCVLGRKVSTTPRRASQGRMEPQVFLMATLTRLDAFYNRERNVLSLARTF
jgi:hypothetical protein